MRWWCAPRGMVCLFLIGFAAAGAAWAEPPQPDGAVATASSQPDRWPAAAAAHQARDLLKQSYPQTQFFALEGRLAQIHGAAFGFGLSAEHSADTFVRTYAEVFGVTPDELLPGNAFDDRYTLPMLYDEVADTYRATLVTYQQFKDGLPVFGADLRLLVQNAPGFPLVLANATLYDLGEFAVRPGEATYDAEGLAYEAASAFEPGLVDFTPAELVIWPDAEGKPPVPRVALAFVGAGMSANGEPKKWRLVCDAGDGTILHAEDLILFTDVVGNVSGRATQGPKAEQCADEVPTAMPWAKVSITGGATAYSDAGGNFVIPNGGSSPVTVQSFMSGLYFFIDDVTGAEETLTMSVAPPGPANFMHNNANNDELVRAQVNGYIQANVVRDWTLAQHPSYPVISTQTNFPVYVNRTDGYCPGNAWYDGSSINFCRANVSQNYGNTAFSVIVHHEYGHHLVASGGSGQGAYGEGASDCCGVLITDDPGLAYGFYYGDCDTPLRNADNNLQYPCSGAIHYCGQLLSGCIWSTRNELVVTEPANYLTVLSKLFVNSIPLHGSSTSITPAIYNTFIALDDTYYGGAHYAEITAGFGAHNMVPAPPPPNDACANALVACPGTLYTGNTSSGSVDGATTCGSSNSTADVWYKYTPATSGSAHFTLCNGTSYDSVMSIHSGCPGTSGNTLGCNDDACGQPYSAPSEVTLNVTAGTTYLVRISGWSGATGAYGLAIEGPACQPTNYTLTTYVSPAGTGAIALDPPGGSYAPGTPVQLTAEAITGWHFDHWEGDLSGGSNPATIVMNSNKSVTAAFAINYYTLTVDTIGPGTVTLDPPGGNYPHGTSVLLTAHAASGARFDYWMGDLAGTANPATILMGSSHAVTARFGLYGDLNCDGLVDFGDINPFVLAVVDPSAYVATFPNCVVLHGDFNDDGVVNFADINPFVAVLTR